MQFGISTHLYHDQRLSRDHLAQVAAYGFDAIELFATRTHFDYHDAASIAQLKRWLSETGLRLHSIHAPITASLKGDEWGTMFSTAFSDGGKRQEAVTEARAALAIAKEIRFGFAVVHLGTPTSSASAGDNNRVAAVRSVDEIRSTADPLGVRLALEVIPNDLSSASTLVSMLEREFDGTTVGLCMDFGHAHLVGGLGDAIETAAEHLITTHVHDNRRRADDHLVPYEGSIDWASALMTMRKIGYDGTLMLEVANTSTPAGVLEEARRARQRMERALSD
jgi:sugar phosphate isomerase/epimerase